MFARVRGTGSTLENALIIPDRAVQEQLGRYFLTVVGEGDKAEMRPVTLGQRFGNRQVILAGLEAGDRVVVEGIQKARPGTPLKVVPVKLEEFDRPAAGCRADPQRRRGDSPPARPERSRTMARFFIDRPVLAIVLSLFLLLIGTLSLLQLPIGEFPNIALPTVQVNANYLGASSDVVEESVTCADRPAGQRRHRHAVHQRRQRRRRQLRRSRSRSTSSAIPTSRRSRCRTACRRRTRSCPRT